MEKLSQGYGYFCKFRVKTETRPFVQVETALLNSGIKDHHKNRDGTESTLLVRPDKGTGFTRCMNALARICASSIPFPADSKYRSWVDGNDAFGQPIVRTGEKNPCYSLKVESIRKASVDATQTWRINISDRKNAGLDMAHVLTCIYADGSLTIYAGTDVEASKEFATDLGRIVRAEYERFCNNYDDTDVRKVVDAELESLKALQVLGKTTNFIARDAEGMNANTDRAEKLVKFIKECGHDAELLGIDGSTRTRDALLSELTSSIMEQFEKFEVTLQAKLDKPNGERARNEGQRSRMHKGAVGDIESIMALADYHCAVLGVVAQSVADRKAELLKKAGEFLTKDFGLSAKQKKLNELAAQIREAKAQAPVEAAKPAWAGEVIGGDVAPAPVAAEVPAAVVMAAAEDPFAGLENQ